jgi:geranylgeranyl pyrophosphate synthase
MSTAKKFSSKMDEKVLEELRQYAKEQERDISAVLTEAVKDLLQKKRLRPAFMKAADQAMEEFDQALEELAK